MTSIKAERPDIPWWRQLLPSTLIYGLGLAVTTYGFSVSPYGDSEQLAIRVICAALIGLLALPAIASSAKMATRSIQDIALWHYGIYQSIHFGLVMICFIGSSSAYWILVCGGLLYGTFVMVLFDENRRDKGFMATRVFDEANDAFNPEHWPFVAKLQPFVGLSFYFAVFVGNDRSLGEMQIPIVLIAFIALGSTRFQFLRGHRFFVQEMIRVSIVVVLIASTFWIA